jgi:hypothetical protein
MNPGRIVRSAQWGLIVLAMLAVAGREPARAEVAATGAFGIDVDVPFPFNMGTFDGEITGFDAGPFDVGGTPVALATDIGGMSIVNGQIPTINIPALTATFTFMLDDQNTTGNSLALTAEGRAICTDALTCAQGQGTFVADVTGITDPNGLLPDTHVYTFDGTVAVDPGPFDAAGVFGLNAYAPIDLPAGVPVMAFSDDTFFDSRKNTLRDFLVDLTFAGVTNPGTVTILGKAAIPGALPANITVHPDISIFVDIVTGGGLAFTPPVDVCVAYDDTNPADGIVDGTSVAVNELKVLHALALGDDFQDVTTTTDGGKVCGRVDQLSPFLVAQGPAPTTTTTSTTTTTLPGTPTTTAVEPTTTTSTTLPERLAGKKLLLKDKAGKPQKRAIDCIAQGGVTLGDGNESADDPVVNGGELRVRGGGFDDTYDLPASGWKYQGKTGAGKGYKFAKGAAIKSVIVKSGKLVRILGKGASLGHDLTTNPAPVDVTLTLGDRKYCLRFGGDVQFKDGTKLLAKNAPAPAACSPSGAFLD